MENQNNLVINGEFQNFKLDISEYYPDLSNTLKLIEDSIHLLDFIQNLNLKRQLSYYDSKNIIQNLYMSLLEEEDIADKDNPIYGFIEKRLINEGLNNNHALYLIVLYVNEILTDISDDTVFNNPNLKVSQFLLEKINFDYVVKIRSQIEKIKSIITEENLFVTGNLTCNIMLNYLTPEKKGNLFDLIYNDWRKLTNLNTSIENYFLIRLVIGEDGSGIYDFEVTPTKYNMAASYLLEGCISYNKNEYFLDQI